MQGIQTIQYTINARKDENDKTLTIEFLNVQFWRHHVVLLTEHLGCVIRICQSQGSRLNFHFEHMHIM